MSKKILANDGIDPLGKSLLEKAGFTVVTEKVKQEDLAKVLKEEKFVGLTVRSATKVRKDIIDACPDLKLIGRGGVGMDNIDVEYAVGKGIAVVNTPAASSHSVAELVFAHLYSMCRFLYDSNKQMAVHGGTKFNDLKKKYASGVELKGKTIGIIGFGRIGQAVARIALGSGMKVLAYDPFVKNSTLTLEINGCENVNVPVSTVSMEEVLRNSDFITLHVPGGSVITSKEFEMMKDGVMIVNASRGGVIRESDLLAALASGKVSHAALDVFENEPTPSTDILSNEKISVSPHIGASTNEAQERIGEELAQKIIDTLK